MHWVDVKIEINSTGKLLPIKHYIYYRRYLHRSGLSIWLAFLLCCCMAQAQAQAEPCQVRGQEIVILHDCVSALERSAVNHEFTVPDSMLANVGRWYRIDLIADADVSDRLLDLGIPDAFQAQVYLQQAGLTQTVLNLNESSRYADRPVQHRNLMALLRLKPGPARVHIYYHSHGKTPMLARLLTAAQLSTSDTLINLLNGLVFGIMLVMVPVLALGFNVQRKFGYRMYGAVVFSTMVFIAQLEGYTFAFLWPEAPAWNMLAPGALGMLMVMTNIAFAINFLQMKSRMPRLYRLYLCMFGLALLVLILHLMYALDNLLIIQSFTYSMIACVVAAQGVRQRIEAARFYFLGTLSVAVFPLLLIGFVLFLVRPSLPFSLLAYPKFGYLAESLLFGAAVISQIGKFNTRQAEQRILRLAETEQLLEAEQGKLAALNKASQQQLQLASASHDIAQPLASLRFAVSALEQHQGNEPIAQHIDHTLEYAQSLLKDLIAQVRDDRHEPEQIVLNKLFAQLGLAFQGVAAKNGLRLSIHTSRLRFEGSSLLLTRILSNLLANAIRYTPKGRVVLGARRRPDGIEILLFDTGSGIPKHIEQNLLRAFQQGSNASSDGFGLGLYIVKNLCHQCGYQLRINSRPGHGSCVAVFIPVLTSN
ncbi:sensor histidine kinase [Undibacterium sp. RuTC16W]|uniref:sensor histidine kinase n=1 Tax=Undibacterium sp. RuTC16W TaxID=3413048 RepID=UPI003BF0A18B